jgi:predicted nucleic acid-binding protein
MSPTRDKFENMIFVDTSAVAALMNARDPYHKQADAYFQKIIEGKYSIVVTNFVIAETHAILVGHAKSIPLGLRWLNEVAYKAFKVIRPSKEDEEGSIKLLNTYKDKAWSLTDAISFHIMEKLNIKYYFSFDDDFRQTGRFLDITRYLGKN